MEVADVPENVSKEDITKTLRANFKACDDILAYKMDAHLIGETELIFLQPETYLLYKEVRIAYGTAAAQVKPSRVLKDDLIKCFFSILVEED